MFEKFILLEIDMLSLNIYGSTDQIYIGGKLNMKSIYETERLLLRILNEENSEQVLDYIVRNKDFFESSEPEREEEFYTINFQAKQLKNDLNYIKSRSMLRLWVFKKDNLNKIIGQVTFYNIVPYAFLSCHLGYKSDKDESGKGFITEAVEEGIKIMFEEYGMHRIEAYVMPTNKASLRVLAKNGFIYEGVAHSFLEVNGVWKDHIHLTLVNNSLV